MRKIVIWALDGGLGSGITGPIDVFMIANTIWSRRNQGQAEPLFEWRIESPEGAPVQTATGVKLHVDGAFNPRAAADVVLVPGIVATSATDVDAAIDRHRALLPALRRQRQRGAVIGANCASTFFLAEAGLLDRRAATTSWWLAAPFRERYPQVDLRADDVVTDDDGLLCSGASTAYLYLALRLVERFGSTGLAVAAAKSLLVDASRTSQAPYKSLTLQTQFAHGDAVVLRAQRWMEKHLKETFRLGNLAEYLCVSERTVIRRFKSALGETPVQHLQLLKVEAAKRLLETTTASVDTICARVGYEDLSSFRRLFRRETGLSPGQYHALFSRRNIDGPSRKTARQGARN